MKKLKAAVCIGAALLLSGCFGGREVNKRSFVQVIAIERKSEIYNVDLQLFRSESSNGEPDISKANSVSVSGRGGSVTEAMADAALKAGNDLFTGHTKLLVIGSGLNDPSDELEVLYGDALSPSCPVVYSREPSEIAGAMLKDGIFSADRIIEIMETYVNTGNCIYTSAAEISEAARVKKCAFPLPVVYTEGEEVYFSGAVLGDKNGIRGTVPESDIYGMVILSDSYPKDCRINISVQVGGLPAAAEIVCADCTKTASYEGEKLVVDADVKLKIRVIENGHDLDEKRIGTAVCENVKNAVISAFSTAVWQNGCDVFGLSGTIQRDIPDMAEKVNENDGELFKSSVLNVKVSGESV